LVKEFQGLKHMPFSPEYPDPLTNVMEEPAVELPLLDGSGAQASGRDIQ